MCIAGMGAETGGPARSVRHLSEYVLHDNNSVQLFTAGPYTMEERSGTVPFASIHELPDVLKRLKNSRETVIHSHGVWHPVNHRASSIANRFRIPLIVSPRGMLEPWSLNYKKWKKRFAWIMYQKRDLLTARVLHATSVQEAENLKALELGVPIAVIPNGVQVTPIRNDKLSREGIKTALFLSRIHPKKGLINLVRAWALVRPPNWRVLIVGPDEGGHRVEVEREIEKQGVSGVFEFSGPADDIEKWDYYAGADLFILPTFSENFGIVIAEALACGLPVITTKGAPWSELDEHRCGWWVDTGVEPLTRALNEAINLPPEERQAMGQRGRKLVEQNYSWDKIGQEMVSVYEWMLGGGPQPECVIMD